MKKLMTIFTAFLLSSMVVLPVAAQDIDHPSRLVDEADLLTEAEEQELLVELNEISEEQAFDVVVVTVESLDGKSVQSFADDYYDYNGYGMGENYDGAILLISMEEREWHISTCGYGITALNDSVLYHMEEEIVPYLSAGEYADAFATFAQMCEYYVNEAVQAGAGAESAGGSGIRVLVGAIVFGFIFAFIPMRGMKKQMKTVAARAEASDYVKRGSRKITKSRDMFLYHTITRVHTPRDTGSSTHRSSSGRSHGGRGGGF